MLSITNDIRNKATHEITSLCNVIAFQAIDDTDIELSCELAKLSDIMNRNQWRASK